MSQSPRIVVAITIVVMAVGLAGAAQAGSGKLKQIATLTSPAGPIDEFDIGFVDQKTQRYYLADRSNKAVDIFDARTGKFIASISGFVGVTLKNGKPDNDTSGPDGVVVFGNQAWVGDGDSTVKVIDLKTDKIVDTVKTGGEGRVDEMAYDPRDHVFIGLNNAAEPPFATLISTRPDHQVLAKIAFSDATDGAEQPVYNPADGMFYVSIPELNKEARKSALAVIDPRKGALVKMLNVENCHPNGLALGARGDLVLGCTADGKEMPPIITVMNPKTGKVVKNVADIGGADMVAYNPRTGQYYTGSRNMPGGPVLGVIDAETNALVQKIALKSGNPHSVAVDQANNHVFVPQSSAGGGCGCVLVFAPE